MATKNYACFLFALVVLSLAAMAIADGDIVTSLLDNPSIPFGDGAIALVENVVVQGNAFCERAVGSLIPLQGAKLTLQCTVLNQVKLTLTKSCSHGGQFAFNFKPSFPVVSGILDCQISLVESTAPAECISPVNFQPQFTGFDFTIPVLNIPVNQPSTPGLVPVVITDIVAPALPENDIVPDTTTTAPTKQRRFWWRRWWRKTRRVQKRVVNTGPLKFFGRRRRV